MPLSDSDRAKYTSETTTVTHTYTLVDRADEAVDIREIMKDMDLWAPDGEFYSYKISCPWSGEHPDGGIDKNCRIYGGTNIFCFAMHGRITPTTLYARWKGVSRDDAARELLDQRGLLSKNWREKWTDLMAEKEQEQGSPEELVSALNKELDNDLIYKLEEFSDPVREVWKKILDDLDLMWYHADLNLLTSWFSASLHKLREAARLANNAR